MDDHHHAQEAFGRGPGSAGDVVPAFVSDSGGTATGADDEALAKLTAALRAGLPGSGQGPDLITGQIPADADPFEFFASLDGRANGDAVQHTQHLPRESLSSGSGIIERRVALMAQDMAAFGGLGREAPLRLDPPGESVRHEYFA